MPRFVTLIIYLFVVQLGYSKPKGDFYQLKVYHLKSNEQLQKVDEYLEHTYIPTLHHYGIQKIGVFKPISNDTSKVKAIYMLLIFKSEQQWIGLMDILDNDKDYQLATKKFDSSLYPQPPYERIQSILL